MTREQTLSWTYFQRKHTETDLHLKKPVTTTKTSVDHMHLLYQLCQVVFLEHSVNLHKIGAKLQKIHCCWWLYDDLPGMILVWHSNVRIVAASIPVHGLACMRPVRHNSKASSCAASFPRWNAYRNNERCPQNMGNILVAGNWPLSFKWTFVGRKRLQENKFWSEQGSRAIWLFIPNDDNNNNNNNNNNNRKHFMDTAMPMPMYRNPEVNRTRHSKSSRPKSNYSNISHLVHGGNPAIFQ